MPSTPQPSPAEMHKQVEEMRRLWEACEREEQEQEEALLRAVVEEERHDAERNGQSDEAKQ